MPTMRAALLSLPSSSTGPLRRLPVCCRLFVSCQFPKIKPVFFRQGNALVFSCSSVLQYSILGERREGGGGGFMLR